jgi:hypothetical protein
LEVIMKTVIVSLLTACLVQMSAPVFAQSGSSPDAAAVRARAEQHAARVRQFQLAQEQASAGDYESAIATARQALAENEDFEAFPLRWNDFVLANVAFWGRDADSLVDHRNRVAEGRSFPANAANVRYLDTLIEGLQADTAVAEARAPEFAVPDPPSGFSWLFVPGTSTALLRPDGWYSTVEENDDAIAAFISLEDWQAEGKFETGLSFNFVQNVSRKTGKTAREYAETMLGVPSPSDVLIKPQGSMLGPGLGFVGLRFRAVFDDTPVIVHRQIIADDVRDSIRLLVFESPEDLWDEMWEVGQLMLQAEIRR